MIGEDNTNNSTIGSIEYINFIKDFGVDRIEISIRNYSTIFVFEDLDLAERFISYLLNKKDEGGFTGDIDNFFKQIARLSPALKQLITKMLIKKINENPKNKLLVDDFKRLLEELKNIKNKDNILDEEDAIVIDGKKIRNKDIANARKNLNKITEDNKIKKYNVYSDNIKKIKDIGEQARLAKKEFLKETTQALKHSGKVYNSKKLDSVKTFSMFSGIKKALGTLLNNNRLGIKSSLNIGKGGVSIESSSKGFGLGFGKGGLGGKDDLGTKISKPEGKNMDAEGTKPKNMNKDTTETIGNNKNNNNDISKNDNKQINNNPSDNLSNSKTNDKNINDNGKSGDQSDVNKSPTKSPVDNRTSDLNNTEHYNQNKEDPLSNNKFSGLADIATEKQQKSNKDGKFETEKNPNDPNDKEKNKQQGIDDPDTNNISPDNDEIEDILGEFNDFDFNIKKRSDEINLSSATKPEITEEDEKISKEFDEFDFDVGKKANEIHTKQNINNSKTNENFSSPPF